ncbi:metallophosphoesterase [Clostridium sp. 19966]|uniref:metallophosphoesterase n=1 Tax=Clostridium sp. 19966 TaxID=2768166 RepID=UPI0028E07F0C|nr:metallophosphoesterase [Clostridium sp. 19966]MDT8719026.1 metallophosphoesterase [Clostridium sp. 19966]
MALYAISDLHLSLSEDKPMDIFGDKWYRHHEKIEANWVSKIKAEDTVLIAGDISWSMKMEDGIKELQWIHALPGRKILIKGNHDYWWGSISKLNSMFSEMNFIQNNFFTYENYAICGSRGWLCPGGDYFKEKDRKIYDRELIRLRLSLEEAKKAGYSKFIAMIHYPPTNDRFELSGFTEIFNEYEVEKVIYGHLHGPFNHNILSGSMNGTEYLLTSCDYINFDPITIIE